MFGLASNPRGSSSRHVDRDVCWWSSSGVKIWRGQWREPSIKSRGWEKKSCNRATVKDSSAAAKVSYGTNSFAKTSGDLKRQ
ncbi:uncharacterized protein LOC131314181 isoform X2 [Rhododendron vialii]|uniref:uncharacterized protein LOC131314181 isoform X2 n=1 Tax=Rhododendron vialii TaxID=182163 RepID=UPI00265F070D|nr:uncharacterized protein LOC131314181 isoform X2 [Rhododendron vialii]